MRAFEIVYADGTVIAGNSRCQFEQAPDDGIQFVIVRDRQGIVQVLKGQSEYEYGGAVKPGSWTERENYDRIKASLIERSNLLVNRDARVRPQRYR